MNFQPAQPIAIPNQWRPRRGRWAHSKAYGRGLKSGLLSRCSLRQMTQSVTFDEAIEFLGEILSVVAAPLQRLRHQQDIKAQRILLAGIVSQVPLKQSVTDPVEFRVGTEDLARVFQVERNKSPMDVFQHVAHNGRHLDKVPDVTPGQLTAARLHALRDPHDEISDAFEVGDALQAS